MRRKGRFEVNGRITFAGTGEGIPNLVVEALDKDLLFDDRLGAAKTNHDGWFRIQYYKEDFQELFFDLKPDIYLRVRKADGTLLLTTRDKVRYEADRTSTFFLEIPKTTLGGDDMAENSLYEYIITGKIDKKSLGKVSTRTTLAAYAVRERRVLGSAIVNAKGAFEIKFKYKTLGKRNAPYSLELIVGPKLPGDQILKTRFERIYLSAKRFKPGSPIWKYEIADAIDLSEPWHIEFDRIFPLMHCEFTYRGFVYTCSPLNIPPGGQAGCVDQEALSCPGGEVEAWVRLSRGSTIIAEDIEIDITGRFEKTITWTSFICLYIFAPVTVEVYQKTDTGEHSLYTGSHWFTHNISEDIFIDRDATEIICTPPDPTPGTGSFFGFERVGNLPVEAIYKAGEVTGEFGPGVPVPSSFTGYANSIDKPGFVAGSADLLVKDFVFWQTIHFYANIGEDFGKPLAGGVDMSDVTVKYFRLKYTYENPETSETISDTYISVPFNNSRRTATGTATDFMGAYLTHPVTGDPLPHPTYIYPNPYDTHADRDWKYRGLVMVLNTNTLPRKFGRYTFTIEPLDASMNPVSGVADPSDCVLTLMVDNDEASLSGEIENVFRAVGPGWASTGVCGIMDLTGVLAGSTSEIKVNYNLHHSHGHLRDYHLTAKYGQNKSVSFPVVNNVYARSGSTPYWNDVVDSSILNHVWQQCAYQFRLSARRRVTNGFSTRWWEEFTYHVTIKSNNPYVP